MKKNVIIVLGPTASGKSDTGIYLAKRVNSEIISADSMQIYQYMDIGTAKLNLSEQEGIPHHLLDIIPPNENFSVNQYRNRAFTIINELLNNKKIPIVVGGTGLYINALTYRLPLSKCGSDLSYRKKLLELSKGKDKDYLHKMLQRVDPEASQSIHSNNHQRIIRALEVYHLTGTRFSEQNSNFREVNTDYNFIIVGITDEREKLYERINNRVDQMIAKGLFEEVKHLMQITDQNAQSMKGIGYKEIIDYYNGSFNYEETILKIKQNSRRYAKRQLTWFNRDPRIKWFNLSCYESFDQMKNSIYGFIKEKI